VSLLPHDTRSLCQEFKPLNGTVEETGLDMEKVRCASRMVDGIRRAALGAPSAARQLTNDAPDTMGAKLIEYAFASEAARLVAVDSSNWARRELRTG
jgi:hypothetical protein